MPDSDDNRPVAGRMQVYENSTGEIFLKIRSSLPGDHHYYALIGRVASEWTHFEHILDEIIWDVSQIPEDVALCITGQMMGATPRFKAIEALTRYAGLPKSLLKKTHALKAQNYAVVEQRNRIVHDPWFLVSDSNPDNDSITQLKASPPGHVPVSKAEIEKTIRQIRNLVVQAGNLQIDFKRELYILRHNPS